MALPNLPVAGQNPWYTERSNFDAGVRAEVEGLPANYVGQLSATAGDQTARINAWLALPAPMGVKRMVGSFSISGTLTVPTGISLDGTGATITQTTNNTPTFVANGVTRVSIFGFKLIGKGTDYVPNTGINPAAGVSILNSSHVSVHHNIAFGFAGVGVKLQACTDSVISDNDITGTSPAAGDGGIGGTQCGVLLEAACKRIQVLDNWISKAGQGICGSVSTQDVLIQGNMIYDITGQHGMYLQNGTRTQIVGNWVEQTAYAGIKCQIYDGSLPADGYGLQINDNRVSGSAHGILVANTEVDGFDRFYTSSQIQNNVVTDCRNEGIHITTIRDSIVSGNTVRDVRGGIYLALSTRTDVTGNTITNATARGIAVDICQDVLIGRNRVTNAGTAGEATTQFGISTASSFTGLNETLVFDGNVITSTAGNMRYGIYIPAGEQAGFSFINNRVTGATDYGVRVLPTVPLKMWRENDVTGTLGQVLGPIADLSGGWTQRRVMGTAAPTTGTWNRGDIVDNRSPSASGNMGWVCVTGGTPGTWKTFGAISA